MVDWLGLLPELVLEIAKNFTFHEDFISFSNVCSSWQSATRNWYDSQRLPSRYPSLLVLDDDQQECQIHLMDGTVRKVQLPKTKLPKAKVICFSSTGGWLLIIEEDTTKAKLFHPVFCRQIDLPNMKSLPDADVYEGFCADRTQVCRVLLSLDPTIEENEQELIVIVICGDRGCLAFCKTGDSSWTAVQGWRSRVVDLCYYQGKAYTFDCGGMIRSCDLHSKNPVMLPVSKRSLIRLEDDIRDVEYDHILPTWNANHEKLFVVSRIYDLYPYSEEELKKLEEFKKYNMGEDLLFFSTQSLSVFECDLKTGEWSKVENLGNRAIFVGLSSSFVMEASNCIMPNCIYFTDSAGNKDFMGDAGNVGKLDMDIYHLSDGSMEPHFSVQSLSETNNPMWIAPPNF